MKNTKLIVGGAILLIVVFISGFLCVKNDFFREYNYLNHYDEGKYAELERTAKEFVETGDTKRLDINYRIDYRSSTDTMYLDLGEFDYKYSPRIKVIIKNFLNSPSYSIIRNVESSEKAKQKIVFFIITNFLLYITLDLIIWLLSLTILRMAISGVSNHLREDRKEQKGNR